MPTVYFEEAKDKHFRFFYTCFSHENWQTLYWGEPIHQDLTTYINGLIHNSYRNFNLFVYSTSLDSFHGFSLFYLDENQEIFGNVGVSPQYIGTGIGVPVTVHSICCAFHRYNSHVIYCNIFKHNLISLSVMQRIGFVKDELQEPGDVYRLTLTRQAFYENPFNQKVLRRYSFLEPSLKE